MYIYQLTCRDYIGELYFSSMKKAESYINDQDGNYRCVYSDQYIRCYESRDYGKAVFEIRKELVNRKLK